MSSFKISVIIPTYKPQTYLWECLDSIKKQSLNKSLFEVVLVLNGCCEPWKSEIEKYIDSLQELNVLLLQSDIPGVSNARNLGLDAASGEFVAFIDDDDYVSPYYLEELYNLTDENTMALSFEQAFEDGNDIYFNYYITSDYLKYAKRGVIPFYLPKRLFSGPVYKLISKRIIGDRRFDLSFKNGEDSLFMFLISDRFKNVVFTSKKAVYYRRIRQNSATTSNSRRIDRTWNLLRLMFQYFKIYFMNPRLYNFRFFVSRILGCLKSVFV